MLDTLTTEGVEPPRTATMVRMQIQPGYRPQPSQHDGQLKLCVPPMTKGCARCTTAPASASTSAAQYSGSGGALPRRRPLGTGRAGFPRTRLGQALKGSWQVVLPVGCCCRG